MANRIRKAFVVAPSDLGSPETCPEWNCPDLSTEDLREGKTCPDHPCTCNQVNGLGVD